MATMTVFSYAMCILIYFFYRELDMTGTTDIRLLELVNGLRLH